MSKNTMKAMILGSLLSAAHVNASEAPDKTLVVPVTAVVTNNVAVDAPVTEVTTNNVVVAAPHKSFLQELDEYFVNELGAWERGGAALIDFFHNTVKTNTAPAVPSSAPVATSASSVNIMRADTAGIGQTIVEDAIIAAPYIKETGEVLVYTGEVVGAVGVVIVNPAAIGAGTALTIVGDVLEDAAAAITGSPMPVTTTTGSSDATNLVRTIITDGSEVLNIVRTLA